MGRGGGGGGTGPTGREAGVRALGVRASRTAAAGRATRNATSCSPVWLAVIPSQPRGSPTWLRRLCARPRISLRQSASPLPPPPPLVFSWGVSGASSQDSQPSWSSLLFLLPLPLLLRAALGAAKNRGLAGLDRNVRVAGPTQISEPQRCPAAVQAMPEEGRGARQHKIGPRCFNKLIGGCLLIVYDCTQ